MKRILAHTVWNLALLGLLAGGTRATAATLVHEYTFPPAPNRGGDIITGGQTKFNKATCFYVSSPKASGATETPLFDAPAGSVQMGMNFPDRSSGLEGSAAIVNFFTKPGAMSFWLYPTATPQNGQYVLNCGNATLVLLFENAGSLRLQMGDRADGGVLWSYDFPGPSQWYHLVINWDPHGAHASQFWVNGSQVGADAMVTNIAPPSLFRVGGFNPYFGDHLANQYRGYLYDLRIYDAPLAADEIGALYANPPASPAGEARANPPGSSGEARASRASYPLAALKLAHRYTFAAPNGSDSVGSANFSVSLNGARTEAPHWVASAPPGSPQASSLQLGMSYPNKNSGLSGASRLNHHGGALSLWLKESVAHEGGRFVLADIGGTSPITLVFNTQNQLTAFVGDGSASSGLLTVGSWYHVLLQWNDVTKSAQLFVNGRQVGGDFNYTRTPDGTFTRVGGWEPTEGNYLTKQFQGYIHDLQIYDGNLTAAQVYTMSMNLF